MLSFDAHSYVSIFSFCIGWQPRLALIRPNSRFQPLMLRNAEWHSGLIKVKSWKCNSLALAQANLARKDRCLHLRLSKISSCRWRCGMTNVMLTRKMRRRVLIHQATNYKSCQTNWFVGSEAAQMDKLPSWIFIDNKISLFTNIQLHVPIRESPPPPSPWNHFLRIKDLKK